MGSEIEQLPDLTARQELFTTGLKVWVLMDCRYIPPGPTSSNQFSQELSSAFAMARSRFSL
jgi:hypothetical protein